MTDDLGEWVISIPKDADDEEVCLDDGAVSWRVRGVTLDLYPSGVVAITRNREIVHAFGPQGWTELQKTTEGWDVALTPKRLRDDG